MATGSESVIDTALFLRTAEALEPVTKNLGELLSQWQQTVSGLRSEWQGDSSDDVKNTAAQVQKSADALLRALNGYRAALREMAGVYDKTEKNVQETGKSLKFGNTFS